MAQDTAGQPTAASTAPAAAWRQSIVMAVAGVFFFALYNAISKELSGAYSPLQIIFFRGLFGLVPIVFFVLHASAKSGKLPRLRSCRPDLQFARAVTALAGSSCLILSYRFLPLADAIAIGYAAPIFVTLFSVPLLSERVGLHRWAAVGIGFFGVMMVARPGVGIVDPAALLPILGAVFYALSLIATRKVAAWDASECTMLHSTGFYVVACLLALPFVWVTPSLGDLALFLALGLVAGCGMFLLVGSYRHADAAVIAPFDYLSMLWAVLFGFTIWGEVPSHWTVAGIGVIALSGLYIVHREQLVARRARVVE